MADFFGRFNPGLSKDWAKISAQPTPDDPNKGQPSPFKTQMDNARENVQRLDKSTGAVGNGVGNWWSQTWRNVAGKNPELDEGYWQQQDEKQKKDVQDAAEILNKPNPDWEPEANPIWAAQDNLRDLQNEYDTAIGDPRGKGRQLTYSEYMGLDDRQRAAIDYNTALKKAIEADQAITDEEKPKDLEVYNDLISDLFIDPTGSDEYAPNTAALLNSLGLDDIQGNVSDYTDYTLVIDDSDLSKMTKLGEYNADSFWSHVPQRDQIVGNLVQKTQAIQAQLDAGKAMITDAGEITDGMQDIGNFADQINAYFSPVAQNMGAPAYEAPELDPFGGRGEQMDAMYRGALENILQKEADGTWDMSTITESMKYNNIDPQDWFSFVGQQLDKADAEGTPLGQDPKNYKYHTSDEVRKLLGLYKVKGG